MERLVRVRDLPKGVVYRKHGQWRWFRNNGANQVFPREIKLAGVQESIALDCLADPQDVTELAPVSTGQSA